MTTVPHDWDDIYAGAHRPPWDIGRPQTAFVRLADQGMLSGRLLDAGCGTGENTLLAASSGADALGIDVAAPAIERARRNASERGVTATFQVADALALDQLGQLFDTVIDSGLFHVFDDDARARYVTSLSSVVHPGGLCYLMCFSDLQPGDWGPRRVRQDELRLAFEDKWDVMAITPDAFDLNHSVGATTAQAWLATLRRN
jgi:2-polyprenyl-3-methyl-5-hydroxy-6-metoxy-1,4-benzoquinol methylase